MKICVIIVQQTLFFIAIYLLQWEENGWLFAQDEFLVSETLLKMFTWRREDLWVGNRKSLLSFHSPAVLSPPLSHVGKKLENAIVVIIAFLLISKSFWILFPHLFSHLTLLHGSQPQVLSQVSNYVHGFPAHHLCMWYNKEFIVLTKKS